MVVLLPTVMDQHPGDDLWQLQPDDGGGQGIVLPLPRSGMSAAINPPQARHKPTQAKSKYRPEIDGLRAFAVVAVIINHFNKDLLPSGYMGVDIFFVISGYVITSSLADRKSKNFLDFLIGFYERRIKRLVPTLVVFVLITSVLISLFNPEPGVALGLGWRSLFGISNISLYRASTNYFAESTELNPFTHTWSLGVEEQFYILFPFLIWFSGFGQQTAKGARNLFFWVGAMTIASLIGFIYLYQVNQPAAYFLTPPRFWEMAAGCLIFIGFQKRARIEQALEQVPPLLVVMVMVGVMFLPVSAAVPATIGIVVLSAILIACLKQGTAAYRFFTLKKIAYVGLISYSLYLWHWTVLSISRWTIGIHWWSVPFQVGLMVLMAIGSYQWIESPIRHSNRWRQSKSSLLTFSLLLPLIGSAALVRTFGKSQIGSYFFIGDKRVTEQLGGLGSTARTHYATSGWSTEKCAFTGKKDSGRDLLLEDCHLKYDQGTGRQKSKKILVIGNSFSVAQIRMYESLSADGYRVYLTSGWGCQIVKTLKTQNSGWKESCEFYNGPVIPKLIKDLSAGDVLLMISDVSTFATEHNNELSGLDQGENEILINGKPSSLDDRLAEARKELESIIHQMKTKGVRVVIQDMTPLTRKYPEPSTCIDPLGIKGASNCVFYEKGRHKIARAKFSEMLKALSRENSNLYILDLFDLLCSKSRCDYTDGTGNLLYRDAAHLSDYGSLQASKVLRILVGTNSKQVSSARLLASP
jgi:peptidoglycan/LPS O-acetylase OafA/YrhL